MINLEWFYFYNAKHLYTISLSFNMNENVYFETVSIAVSDS